MKVLRRWFFPCLACLIVLGAALLPARISEARDAAQLGQVHAEELEADSLSLRDPPDLLDRIALYARWYSHRDPILSFQDAVYEYSTAEDSIALEAQNLLTESGVLPRILFREDPFDYVLVTRLMLWNPEDGAAAQGPAIFWDITWQQHFSQSHQKSIHAVIDAETRLPIYLRVKDTNMSQWLPYRTRDLRARSEQFFTLLGLEVQVADVQTAEDLLRRLESFGLTDWSANSDSSTSSLNLFCETDAPILYRASRTPTVYFIEPNFVPQDGPK